MNRNKLIYNLIKPAVFAILLTAILFAVYGTLKWKDNQVDYISIPEQMESLEKNTVDVAFVGSSHVYRGIYPAVLWNDYGYTSYDLSVSEQDISCGYQMLASFLEKESPKIVFVEALDLLVKEHGNPGDLYRNIYSIDSIKGKYEIARYNATEEKTITYLLGWPVFHTRYKERKIYDYYSNPANSFLRGENVDNGKEKGKLNYDVIIIEESEAISAENKEWIDKLCALSEEKDFKLVFFMTPYEQDEEERLVENGIKEYVNSKGIDYIDFSLLLDELDFDPENDMGDVWHCNISGANKLTKYLGEYIHEYCQLSDRRGEDGTEAWDKDYEYYRQMVLYYDLKNASGNEEVISLIKGGKHLTTILSIEGDCNNITGVIEQMGISPEETRMGGKWIYKDGVLTKLISNTPGEIKEVELDRFNSFRVSFGSGGDYYANVLFNNEGMNYYGNGLNIIVYDEFRQTILGNFGIEN